MDVFKDIECFVKIMIIYHQLIDEGIINTYNYRLKLLEGKKY